MRWQLLGALSEPDRREVLAAARRRRFAKGEVVFHEGDPGDMLHLIDRGHVAVRVTTPAGDVALIRVLGPGGWFGELAVLDPAPRNATVSAIDPVETLSLHRDQFAELRVRHPGIDGVLTDALIAEVRRLSGHLGEALYLPADKRVWRRLLEVAELYPDVDGAVTVPLTQADVAQLAGTTRPTANQALRDAEDAGFVRIGRGRVDVLDASGLARRAR